MPADTVFKKVTVVNTILLPSLSGKLLFQLGTIGDQPTGLRIRRQPQHMRACISLQTVGAHAHRAVITAGQINTHTYFTL